MKNQSKVLLFGTCLTVAGMVLSPNRGMAQDETLQDGGSMTMVNLGGPLGTGNLGMNNWTVYNGATMQNQLNQQWFWISIAGVNGGKPQSIDQLSAATINAQAPNFLDVSYSDGLASVEVSYFLSGGGMNSGSADITESVTVNNVSGSGISINLFEYSNFNLLGEGNDSLLISGNAANGYTEAFQFNGSTSLAEGIVNPNANNAEAGNFASTLTDVEAGTLNGNTTSGPGDEAWAFEWSQNIGAGSQFDVLKDKELQIAMVPEPSTIALIGLGLGAVGLIRRKAS
jgi:PEP-CTERM motif